MFPGCGGYRSDGPSPRRLNNESSLEAMRLDETSFPLGGSMLALLNHLPLAVFMKMAKQAVRRRRSPSGTPPLDQRRVF